MQPRWWLVENPVGKLRKLPVQAGVPRRQVTYCRYGRPFRKPTDLWGYPPPLMTFAAPCDAVASVTVEMNGMRWCVSRSSGPPCHVAAPRGSTPETQGT